MTEKKLWFKAKDYGWGWYPASREGWFVIAWYTLAIVIIFREINLDAQSGSDAVIGIMIPFLIVTAILIAICYKTGEKPEWRWGKKK